MSEPTTPLARPVTAVIGGDVATAIAEGLPLLFRVRGLSVCATEGDWWDQAAPMDRMGGITEHADVGLLYITPALLGDPAFWAGAAATAMRRAVTDQTFRLLLIYAGVTADQVAAAMSPDSPPVTAVPALALMESGPPGKSDPAAVASRALALGLTARRTQLRAGPDYVPTIWLRTFAVRPGPGTPDLDLDWTELFPNNDYYGRDWDTVIGPALQDLCSVLNAQVPAQQFRLLLKARLPAALALGLAFGTRTGWQLEVQTDQRTWWNTATSPSGVPIPGPLRYAVKGDPRLAVVELAASNETHDAVMQALPRLRLRPGHQVRLEPPGGPSGESIPDAATALALAAAVGQELRNLTGQGVRHIHLFPASLAPLMVLIGRHLNAVAPTTVYVRLPDGRYEPAHTFNGPAPELPLLPFPVEQWNGVKRKQLYEALLDAFRSEGDLKKMLLFGLDTQLAQIMSSGNLSQEIFDLIEWAEANGKLEDLLKAVHESRPDNPRIRVFLLDVWPDGLPL
ncbi:MAG TPA: SAVED domain-containing protein [Chloroflexia bacterium]|nr:SAVED domain-containing protein [Chloroflexia bacterium]